MHLIDCEIVDVKVFPTDVGGPAKPDHEFEAIILLYINNNELLNT